MCQLIHVLPYKLVTSGVEQRREAPRIPECYKMGFAGIEINVKHSELGYLLSCESGLVQTSTLIG